MSSAVLCVAMLTVAVDYGYEPMPGDGIRYVFQIEPTMLDVLRRGEPLVSTIPSEVRGRIHEFRMVSNYDKLSQEIPPLTQEPESPTLPPVQSDPPYDLFPRNPPNQDGFPTLPPLSIADPPLAESPPKLLDPMVVPTSATEPSLDGPSGKSAEMDAQEPNPLETRLGLYLVLAIVVAAGSSTGMLWFGWLAVDYRSRYLGLLQDSMKADSSWLDDPLDVAGHQPDVPESVDALITLPEEVQPRNSADDSAWRDLGADTEAPLDDWLDEDRDRKRESRRSGKKSR